MARKTKRVALYLRVSTDRQTTNNQERDLREWAERAGHEVVAVYSDQGISGTTGREQRPALRKMLEDAKRRRFDVVAVWAIDRLGRSLSKVVQIMDELHELGIGQFYYKQAIDTTTAGGKAMIQMAAVFAEFERGFMVERIKSGLERARAEGKSFGRPKGAMAEKVLKQDEIVELREAGKSIRKIAALVGVSPPTVQKALKRHEEAQNASA